MAVLISPPSLITSYLAASLQGESERCLHLKRFPANQSRDHDGGSKRRARHSDSAEKFSKTFTLYSDVIELEVEEQITRIHNFVCFVIPVCEFPLTVVSFYPVDFAGAKGKFLKWILIQTTKFTKVFGTLSSEWNFSIYRENFKRWNVFRFSTLD